MSRHQFGTLLFSPLMVRQKQTSRYRDISRWAKDWGRLPSPIQVALGGQLHHLIGMADSERADGPEIPEIPEIPALHR